MSCPSRPASFNYPTSIWWRQPSLQTMRLIVKQLSPPYCHFIHFSYVGIFTASPCSQTPSICALPLTRDQDSYPYKITGTLRLFLSRRGEDKSFWTGLQQALPELNLLLVSTWMDYVTVLKHLNFATFSNDLLATSVGLRQMCHQNVIRHRTAVTTPTTATTPKNEKSPIYIFWKFWLEHLRNKNNQQ
jgi:hypothetical protein